MITFKDDGRCRCDSQEALADYPSIYSLYGFGATREESIADLLPKLVRFRDELSAEIAALQLPPAPEKEAS